MSNGTPPNGPTPPHDLAPPTEDTAPASTPFGEKPPPNFAARRMLASTVALTVLVIAAVFVYRLVTGGDTNLLGSDSAEWDRLALVDLGDGSVVLPDGENEADVTTGGTGAVIAVHHDGDQIVLQTRSQLIVASLTPTSDALNDDDTASTTSDATDSTTTDSTATDADAPRVVADVAAGEQVTRLDVDGLVFAIGSADGGNVTIVDAVGSRSVDVGELAGNSAPRYFVDTLRYDPAGERFAIADTTTFQTVVVTLDGDEPLYLPDIPVAVGSDAIATSQIVGNRADLTLFDTDGSEIAEGSTDLIASATIERHELTGVTATGDLIRLERDDDDITTVATLAVPTGELPTTIDALDGNERFVVSGDIFAMVVDDDGETLATVTFDEPVDSPTIEPGWRCLPLGAPSNPHTLIDGDSGRELADLTDFTDVQASVDGCHLLGRTADGYVHLSIDPGDDDADPQSVPLDGLDGAWLSPDGESVVSLSTGGRVGLLRMGEDDDGEPAFEVVADLSDVAPAEFDVAFLEQ